MTPNPRDADPLNPTDVDRAYAEGFEDGWESTAPRRSGLAGLLLVIGITAVFWLTVGFFAGRASAAAPSSPSPEPSFVPVPTTPRNEPDAGPTYSGAPSGLPHVSASSAAPASAETAERTTAPTPKPTPRPKPAPVARGHVRSGTASWYDDPRKSGLYAAAGPPLRVGDWRGRTVTVSAGGHSFRVVLSDWCACPERVIDLSPAAFSRLAPLSRGLTRITVTW